MKKIFILFPLVFTLNLQAAISIISDLDDTIKITNSANEADAARRGLFSDDVFTEMPEFLNAVRAYVSEVHILSASPSILKSKIERTFKKKGIRVDSITLKSAISRESTPAYKLAAIRKLLNQSSDDFIFFGDDVDKDPEIYAAIAKEYPNRVLAIYIHAIRGRELPKNSIRYWTTFDLFLKEYKGGRMLKHEVKEAGERMVKDLRVDLMIPGFADCPKTPGVWMWQMATVFAKEAGLLMAKLNLYCTARQSTIVELQ